MQILPPNEQMPEPEFSFTSWIWALRAMSLSTYLWSGSGLEVKDEDVGQETYLSEKNSHPSDGCTTGDEPAVWI